MNLMARAGPGLQAEGACNKRPASTGHGLSVLPYRHSSGAEQSHTRAFADQHLRSSSMHRHGGCDGFWLLICCARASKLLDRLHVVKSVGWCTLHAA